jgi:hypothetical protein
MYFDWFISQLAFALALVYGLLEGMHSRAFRRMLHDCLIVVAVAAVITLPVTLYLLLHFLFLDWNLIRGFGTNWEQNVMTLRSTRVVALLEYARSLREYFTLPVLLAASAGIVLLGRDRKRWPAAALLGGWIALHICFFGILTGIGGSETRAFQIAEIPVALLASFAVSEVVLWIAKRLRGVEWIGGRVAAALAFSVGLAGVLSVAGGGLAALYRGVDGLQSRMPRFHRQYYTGPAVPDLCADLASVIPPGSNLLAPQYSWQLVEAVCPGAERWQFVNMGGLCRRKGADARRSYLRTYFPRYRDPAPHFAMIERPDRETFVKQSQCLAEFMELMEATGRERVTSGAGTVRFGPYDVVRIER